MLARASRSSRTRAMLAAIRREMFSGTAHKRQRLEAAVLRDSEDDEGGGAPSDSDESLFAAPMAVAAPAPAAAAPEAAEPRRVFTDIPERQQSHAMRMRRLADRQYAAELQEEQIGGPDYECQVCRIARMRDQTQISAQVEQVMRLYDQLRCSSNPNTVYMQMAHAFNHSVVEFQQRRGVRVRPWTRAMLRYHYENCDPLQGPLHAIQRRLAQDAEMSDYLYRHRLYFRLASDPPDAPLHIDAPVARELDRLGGSMLRTFHALLRHDPAFRRAHRAAEQAAETPLGQRAAAGGAEARGGVGSGVGHVRVSEAAQAASATLVERLARRA